MSKIAPVPVPEASLLAEFGHSGAYRDCFARDVAHGDGRPVGLEQFVERFYCSAAFRPERLLLGLARRDGAWKASDEDARAVARGETERFAVWTVAGRRSHELLLKDHRGATASWFSTLSLPTSKTRLLFGSWVGEPERPLVKALMPFHRWYSRVLLASAARGFD